MAHGRQSEVDDDLRLQRRGSICNDNGGASLTPPPLSIAQKRCLQHLSPVYDAELEICFGGPDFRGSRTFSFLSWGRSEGEKIPWHVLPTRRSRSALRLLVSGAWTLASHERGQGTCPSST